MTLPQMTENRTVLSYCGQSWYTRWNADV